MCTHKQAMAKIQSKSNVLWPYGIAADQVKCYIYII